jgi:tetratricopeptide (TPR) repeat protein
MRFVVIFLLVSMELCAQDFLPDSVRSKFTNVPKDSIYIDRLNALSLEYLRTNPGISRQISEHAIHLAQQIRYTKGYGRALTMMGNSYWTEGIYEFAQNYYLLAARQYKLINDSTGLGQTYNNIGEVYKKLNDNQKALEYLLQSTELKKKDKATRAITLYNIGELYVKLRQKENALRYLDQSMAIATAEGNQRVIAFDYWSYGALEANEKNYDDALTFYFKAEAIWKKIHDLRSLIQTYQEIAELYRLQHKYDEGEKYLSEAFRLSGQIKVADLQVNNYLRFAKLDSARGNYSRAFYYLSRHNSLKDSVYNLLKVEQIARIQAIYETEASENENKQLRAETELQESQLRGQKLILVAISVCLVALGLFVWVLNSQRRKIQEQKEAIEVQATALIKLNDELQELNKTLEARITERTNQLTIQNQRLTDYTFVNAHKLRAPVASILGLLNLISQVPDNERPVLLAHLKTCGEQLDATIHDLSRSLEGAIVTDNK